MAAFGLWSLPSFDEPRDEPAAVAAAGARGRRTQRRRRRRWKRSSWRPVKPPTLEEIEAIRQDAYNEGFATGERDGFHAGQLKARQEAEEALKERLQSLERLMTQLLEPIAEQDALIEQGMVNLVNHVARQVIQRELHMDSSHVRQVLREALKLAADGRGEHPYPLSTRRISRAGQALRERHEESWRILEDDSLLPGGCRIETEHSRIDATIETRLAQAVKQLFEQQREQAAHPLASDIRIDLDAPGDVDAP
ncbi:flagellar assembly protein FliH [Klebsiella pneumoniae]